MWESDSEILWKSWGEKHWNMRGYILLVWPVSSVRLGSGMHWDPDPGLQMSQSVMIGHRQNFTMSHSRSHWMRSVSWSRIWDIRWSPGRNCQAAGEIFVIAFLFLVLQHFGILNHLAPDSLAETGMGYGMLFVIGLITSVHCIAMCGGINLSQTLLMH